jgi:putative peptidoglycan lipid II flippase
MAAMLEPGSVASLNFGGRITAFAVSVGAFALGAVALPHFSQLVAQSGWPALAASLRRQFTALGLVTLPATALLILLARPLVELLFERGSFDASDTALVALTHALYALQIPFALAGTLVVRAISAVGANHILISAAAINIVVNIGLNLLFMRWLGAPGIALSTACVYFVSTVYCLSALRRTMRRRAPIGAG